MTFNLQLDYFLRFILELEFLDEGWTQFPWFREPISFSLWFSSWDLKIKPFFGGKSFWISTRGGGVPVFEVLDP